MKNPRGKNSRSRRYDSAWRRLSRQEFPPSPSEDPAKGSIRGVFSDAEILVLSPRPRGSVIHMLWRRRPQPPAPRQVLESFALRILHQLRTAKPLGNDTTPQVLDLARALPFPEPGSMDCTFLLAAPAWNSDPRWGTRAWKARRGADFQANQHPPSALTAAWPRALGGGVRIEVEGPTATATIKPRNWSYWHGFLSFSQAVLTLLQGGVVEAVQN